jgi:predicted enzyme related to lactoylglutathione lyase
MHHSRLAAIVIDSRTDDLDTEASFWGAALGLSATRPEGTDRYRDLDGAADQPKVLLQQVEHDSRVHLDIETDDIEAEVARLEALGARRVGNVKSWCVMEAPSGQRFCVVPPQRGDFPAGANQWP